MKKQVAALLLITGSFVLARSAFAGGNGSRVFNVELDMLDHQTLFDADTGEYIESVDLLGTLKTGDESDYISGFWGGLDLSSYIESYFAEVIQPIADYSSANYSAVGPAPEDSPYYELNPEFERYLSVGFQNINRDELIQMVTDHLQDEEGFRSFIYDDANGKPWTQSKIGNPTIGYGHLVKPEEMAQFANGISEPDAYRLLLQDITTHLNPIIPAVKVPLRLKQWVMLASHAFNSGPNAVKNSTYLKMINGNSPLAAIEKSFKEWNKMTIKQNGKPVKVVVQGLVNRRFREWQMFTESIAMNEPLIYLA